MPPAPVGDRPESGRVNPAERTTRLEREIDFEIAFLWDDLMAIPEDHRTLAVRIARAAFGQGFRKALREPSWAKDLGYGT